MPLFLRSYRGLIALCLISLLSLASTTLSAETDAEYKQRLKGLDRTIKQLQKDLKATKGSRSELQNALQKSEQEISQQAQKVKQIKEALAREKKQLSQLRSQRSKLEGQRQEQQQHIGSAIRQAHQLGQQSQVKLLLNQESPQRVSRLLRYHDYVVMAHQERVSAYLETIDELNHLEPTIVAANEQLQQQQSKLKQRQQQLQSTQKQRISTLKQLNRRLSQKGNALNQLKLDQQRLQDLLDEATQALANLTLPSDAKPFTRLKGKLPLPTQGKVIHQFGNSRFDGKLRWNGVFIANKTGAKVVSVHHGRVIFSDYLRGQGLLLIVDHGNGYMSLYAHNQTLLKEIGDWVSSGETIATVGSSGGQQRAGLYFEIRHKGQPQNPSPWLKRG